MEFNVLGPLEVIDGGHSIPLGGGKQRAAFALLVLRRNRVVSRDELIDGVWGASPPTTADQTLKTYVSRLRRVLPEGEGPRLVTRAPGYTLRVEPGELDLERFEGLVGEAREALAREDPARARDLVREALALFRGTPLHDLAHAPFAQVEVARLEEAKLRALELRIEADLLTGGHAEVTSELELLVAHNPFRERLWEQLMLALYRSGRQADALLAFDRARRTLAGELGVDPSQPLQRLHQKILQQDPSIEAPAEPEERPVWTREGPSRRRWSPPRTGLVAAVLVVLVVAVTFVATRGNGGRGAVPVAPSPSHGKSLAAVDRLLRIEPLNRKVIASIPLARSPAGIAVGEGSIWVVADDGTIDRIDPVTSKITGVIHVAAGAAGIAFDEGSIWVANKLKSSVEEIDPGTNRVVATISVDQPVTIAAGGGVLFVGTFGHVDPSGNYRASSTLIDEKSQRVIKTLIGGRTFVPDAPWVAEGDGVAWTGGTSGILDKVNPNTGELIKRADLGYPVAGLAVAEGGVWIASDGQPGQVRFVDAAKLRITATIPVGTTSKAVGGRFGSPPIWMAGGNGSLWVTNADDGTISQIVTVSNITAHTVDVGRRPTGVAFGFNSLWVTVDAP